MVAVSGGADSTALLLALDELGRAGKLGISLTVTHLDHLLRKKASKEDAEWVANLAQKLGAPVELGRINVRKQASETADNLEQAARRARYAFLAKAARKKGAKLILTAHTMDDQAETVLLRLLRGSGAEGLGGIEPVRPLDPRSRTLIARPLLTWARRSDTEDYCDKQKTGFRVDEMNKDERFARVRVRRQLIPLMQSFNGRIVDALSRTAELLRADASILAQEADILLRLATEGTPTAKLETKPPLVNVQILAKAPLALRRRALRQWILRARGDLRRLEMVHLLSVERLLCGNRGGKVVELPGGASIQRKRGWLEFRLKR